MKYLDFMTNLAKEAGALAQNTFSQIENAGIETKATAKDIVTVADRKTEKFIISRLLEAFPDYNIFGEETGSTHRSDSEYLWVIDPIDGTSNYAAGLPYAISIGLMKGKEHIAGVVYAPRSDKMFAAETGKGATLNGNPLHVSNRDKLIESIGVTGFACLRANLTRNNLQAFCAIAPQLRGIRRFGCASLDICSVAAGCTEFFWEYPLSLYDIAGAAVVLKEAGGTVTDFDGGNEYPEKGIVVSNTILHRAIQQLILENDYR